MIPLSFLFQLPKIQITMTNEPIQTIDEYLELRDWKFDESQIQLEEGRHQDFFWLRSSELGDTDLLATIDLPSEPFSVLVTHFDGPGAIYASKIGWRQLGDYAISGRSTILPKLYHGADNAQMFLDQDIADEELMLALLDFDEPYSLDDLQQEETGRFWRAIENNPYCYFSYGLVGNFTFVGRGHHTLQQFLEQVWSTDFKEYYKRKEAFERERLWKILGPESGAETCVEPDCSRLRIKLAVRCFIHQLLWNKNFNADDES